MSHVYCPECGFQNPEASNYCAKCGALLVRDEGGSDTTMSYTPEEGDEDSGAVLDEIKAEGPALVVRSGGGRSGETFHPTGQRTLIGRSPTVTCRPSGAMRQPLGSSVTPLPL